MSALAPTSLEELLQDVPPVRLTAASAVREVRARRAKHVFVVLDDDPTGTQSIASVPVLTRWEREDFAWAFSTTCEAIYVLSNTRSLDEAATAARCREIASTALEVARELQLAVSFVSRSDSTLRGHFPLETDVLGELIARETGSAIDGVILIPLRVRVG